MRTGGLDETETVWGLGPVYTAVDIGVDKGRTVLDQVSNYDILTDVCAPWN
jgi:hypothetical protein